MKIELSAPDTPYKTIMDTEVMDVLLRDVFNGVTLQTDNGQKLSICMRDDGFEAHYYKDNDSGTDFDTGWTMLKQGLVIPRSMVARS